MKKNKGNESSSTKPTDLSDNVLKYQNTMLATHIDILKRELAKAEANTQSCSDAQNPSIVIQQITDELQYYQSQSHQLARRIRIIMAYNKCAIEKKSFQPPEELLKESYECLCGSKQMESLKYEVIQNFDEKYNQFLKSTLQIEEPIIPEQNQEAGQQLQQDVEAQPQKIMDTSDSYKDLVNQWVEEKANLKHQLEDLKISQKLSEEQFYQSHLFADLVQQNNALTSNIFHLEDQLVQSQMDIQDLFEKNQQQIIQIQNDCQYKIKEIIENQIQQKIEVIKQDDGSEKLKESLHTQIKALEKVIEDMKIELQQQRDRNKEIQLALNNEIQNKQTQISQINELKQTLNVLKIITQQEKIDQITLRYEKHKQLLYEIEQEYINQKNQDFIQRFREFVGYVKMRDDKVKGLEQLIETKHQDNLSMKKVFNKQIQQMQSMFDELDYNAQVYASQIDNNKTLSKLLDETQKNESRAMKEKTDERAKYEVEKITSQQKITSLDEQLKAYQIQNEVYRKLSNQIEQERQSQKETIRMMIKQDNENKQKLAQKELECQQKQLELKIFLEREKLSDSINSKYIKSAEKSKAKQKVLKLQLKNESKDRGTDLLESMKMMINCQQCKKSIKQVILIKCLHMFCQACIDDNQKNRNRACPICRTRYGLEDTKQIKLT